MDVVGPVRFAPPARSPLGGPVRRRSRNFLPRMVPGIICIIKRDMRRWGPNIGSQAVGVQCIQECVAGHYGVPPFPPFMTLTFFDRFILYLALELFQDAQPIQDWLHKTFEHNNDKNNHNHNQGRGSDISPELYWRSRPHLDQQPRFIDVTFSVADSKIQLRLGYLYSSSPSSRGGGGEKGGADGRSVQDDPSSPSSYYVSWRHPFSPRELKNLARSLDLVFDVVDNDDESRTKDPNVNGDEATARAFSASFARALEESKLRFGTENDHVNSLQCYYSELDQWGSLSCPQEVLGGTAGWSESELDATCTHLLFQNLRSFDVVSSDKATTTTTMTTTTITELDRTTVKDALERCLAQEPLHRLSSGGEGVVKAVSTTAPGGMPLVPLVSTVPANTKTGYRQMPKKRRRGPSELKFKAGSES